MMLSLWMAGLAMAPPVSFSREIAPLLAMECNGCHGEAGGLSLRSYRDLMLGGNLGKVVVPGDPEQSLILHFVDGRRGEKHRMPKDSPPLRQEQIDTLKRWIEQGAIEDHLSTRVWKRVLPSVPMSTTEPTRVLCKVDVPAYLVIRMRRPGDRGEVLWEDAVSVKKPKERGDAAEPGHAIHWDLRAGDGWPRFARLELEIRYAASEPRIEFSAEPLTPPRQR
jgi:hypothetical protein